MITETGMQYINDAFDALEYGKVYYRGFDFHDKYKVFFNDKKKTTTLLEFDFTGEVWKKTIVKATDTDEYSREFGFLMAYFQHNEGLNKGQTKRVLDKVLEKGDK